MPVGLTVSSRLTSAKLQRPPHLKALPATYPSLNFCAPESFLGCGEWDLVLGHCLTMRPAGLSVASSFFAAYNYQSLFPKPQVCICMPLRTAVWLTAGGCSHSQDLVLLSEQGHTPEPHQPAMTISNLFSEARDWGKLLAAEEVEREGTGRRSKTQESGRARKLLMARENRVCREGWGRGRADIKKDLAPRR